MKRGKIYLTNIERAVADFLDKKGISYCPQFSTRTGFVIDFAIVDQRIAIEVDGEKWHSSEEARKRDRFKDYQLRREGWRVIRVKENQLDNLESMVD